MRSRGGLALGLSMLALGCAQVSGLSDFRLDGGGGSGAGGSGTGTGTGTGTMTGSGGSSGQPVAIGPFGEIGAVSSLANQSDDDDPTFTADGLQLYFNTNRGGNSFIWRAARDDVGADWGSAVPVTALFVGNGDTNGVISPDGSTFWLIAEAPGYTIYVSERSGPGWPSPAVDEAQSDPQFGFVGAVDAGMVRMVYANGDLHESTRSSPSDDWSAPAPLANLDEGNDVSPWMSPDGLHIYWSADGVIYRSARPSLEEDFVAPTPVTELQVAGYLSDPWLTPDQSYIMFSIGSTDRQIYEARRAKP